MEGIVEMTKQDLKIWKATFEKNINKRYRRGTLKVLEDYMFNIGEFVLIFLFIIVLPFILLAQKKNRRGKRNDR